MKNKLIIVCLISLLSCFNLKAQQVEKGFELTQLVKIADVYQHAQNLSFNIDYTYADSSQPSTLLEEMTGSSKISNGRFWTYLDSIEVVQGYQYNVAVYYNDSNIVVNDRQDYNQILKLPVLDSIFRVSSVDSMNIQQFLDPSNGTDTVRELTVYFGSNTQFRNYKLRYNPKTYLIQFIQYYIRNVPIESGGITSGTALMKLNFSGYSQVQIDPQVFLEDRFIYKLNGALYAKPAYSAFKLFSNINPQPGQNAN